MKVNAKLQKVLAIITFFCMVFLMGRGAGYLQETAALVSHVSYSENWGLGFGESGTQPTGNASPEEMAKYNAYYMGNKDKNVIYLTFDCGYENGNTPAILDALKKHQAKATFFVVGHFLESSPELVQRMVQEGHTVGNHTYHHPDMSSISTMSAFQKELDDVRTLYKEVTGQEMTKYYLLSAGKIQHRKFKNGTGIGLSHVFLEPCLC